MIDIQIGEERIIALSEKRDCVFCGTYEFPFAGKHPDGRIFVNYNVYGDCFETLNHPRAWAVSKDNGETWESFDIEKEPAAETVLGVQLSNGEYIKPYAGPNVPIDKDTYKKLSKHILVDKKHPIQPFEGYYVPVYNLPDDLIPKNYRFIESYDNLSKTKIVECKVDFPSMIVPILPDQIVTPIAYDGKLRLAPDGSLWLPLYQRDYDAETKTYYRPYASYYLKSSDNGEHFEVMSKISYLLEDAATVREGFCEPAITFLPDGSMITIMRTFGYYAPSYIARSTDGGRTWSEPVQFDYCGVAPKMHTFESGITVASYGRPGLYIRVTEDESGMNWEEPIEIIPRVYSEKPEELENAINQVSCFNPDILPISDDALLLFYSDHTYRDEEGKVRQSIRVRKITVRKV